MTKKSHQLSTSDVLEITDDLESRNLCFRKLWEVCDVVVTSEIDTACVRLTGNSVQFMFNDVMWQTMTPVFKAFVLCHEQMHLMQNHFNRLHFEYGDAALKNIAADLTINHCLIRNYDFDRQRDIPEWEKYCWVDTVFDDPEGISTNETVEYYYALLKSKQLKDGVATMDDHSTWTEISDEIRKILDEDIKQHVADNTQGLPADETEQWLDEFNDMLDTSMSTTGFGNGSQQWDLPKTHNSNWKYIYYQIPRSLHKEQTESNWIATQRRYAMLPNELMLPTDHEVTVDHVVRVNVYLDTSGSCIDHAKHFLESALSLPNKLFKVTVCGFCTEVYDVPTRPPYNLRGFGNESYQKVSDHVDAAGKLDAVIVFTDGYSAKITPTHPTKWHWFITPNGTTKNIDARCHTHDLTKYNWTG